VNDLKPDEYWFFLNFAQAVTPNQFNDGRGSWAAIFLDTNNDGNDDFSLETNTETYKTIFIIPGNLLIEHQVAL
jgi:hypothetical protein